MQTPVHALCIQQYGPYPLPNYTSCGTLWTWTLDSNVKQRRQATGDGELTQISIRMRSTLLCAADEVLFLRAGQYKCR